MEEFFDIPTLIVIGVAIVVLFRLRSVLGTRTGNERSPLQRAQEAQSKAAKADAAPTDNVTPLRPAPMPADPDRRALKLDAEIEQFSHGDANLAAGFRAIAEAEPNRVVRIDADDVPEAVSARMLHEVQRRLDS